jgi:hypothetical protein
MLIHMHGSRISARKSPKEPENAGKGAALLGRTGQLFPGLLKRSGTNVPQSILVTVPGLA